MTYDCDCCEGISLLTPRAIVNRPGLDALAYRVGTHHSFLQTMLVRLSSQQFPALADLKTRETDDFAIALLDGWATVADVLTFYQERIANEGYLRTATERRSVLELARLVGYQLRPGVSASVYLAFSLEKDFNDDNVFIPAGTQAQSVPGPNELPQTFETEKNEPARTDWNRLQPRLTQPQYISQDDPNDPKNPNNASNIPVIYAEGVLSELKANDRLAFVFNNDFPTIRSVRTVEPQPADQRTKITLILPPPLDDGQRDDDDSQREDEEESTEVEPNSRTLPIPIRAISQQQLATLGKPPVTTPANALRLVRPESQAFNLATDLAPNLLTKFQRFPKDSFYTAWQNTPITNPSPLNSTEVFKVKAAPFGHNAQPKVIYDDRGRPAGTEEWGIENLTYRVEVIFAENPTAGISDLVPATANIGIRDQGKTYTRPVSVPSAASTPSGTNTVPIGFPGGIRAELSRGPDGGEQQVLPNITVRFFDVAVSDSEPVKQILIHGEPGDGFVNVDRDGNVRLPFEESSGHGSVSYRVGTRTVLIESRGQVSIFVQDITEAGVRASQRKVLALDAQYDKILPDSWVVLEQPSRAAKTRTFRVKEVQTVSLNRYGLTGKVTQLVLSGDWLSQDDVYLSDMQDVTVYAQSEPLTLAEEVIDADIKGDEDIELSTLEKDLQAGRWLIVTGERTDIPNTTGVQGTELVMLAAVRQGVGELSEEERPTVRSERSNTSPANGSPLIAIPGDKPHSFLQLEKPLEFTYKRDTVIIYGNVVKATHGETRQEVLGSGDSSQSFQQFALRQPPLTFVSAPTPSGIDSTLEVLVNQVQWHEVESLGGLGPSDRAFITRNDNDGNTQITFGDGHRGLRLPTGIENVRAKYRSGIGKGGNVKAEQISLLASRPLGVKDVINPLAATGGADPESRDQARRNAPLAVMALDRLVSVQDYEDFARTFAGIGKASVAQLSDGRRQVIHLTIAGEADIPIAPTSDLYRNLLLALRTYGSPNRWVQVAVRDLMLLLIAVKVRILPDYRWEFVAPAIRTALLETFSFERRSLGQAVRSSEVIAAIHQVPGVDYVDLDVLASIAESEVAGAPEPDPPPGDDPAPGNDPKPAKPTWLDTLEAIAGSNPPPPAPVIPVELARIDPDSGGLLPAQLAILSPDIPDTLKIEELAP